MDAEENVTQPLYFGAKRSPHPRSLNHYLYFSSASHKAGAIATKGYFQVKEFLSREIPILPKRNQAENSESTAVQTPEELLRTNRDLKKENLKQLVQRANEVLAEASTVFPFTLFLTLLFLTGLN